MSTAYPRDEITGVILAGGRAKRMGGQDKGLIKLGDTSMVEHVIGALRPQVGALLINANRNPDAYGQYRYPVIPDLVGSYFGPLAGMASAIQHAETRFIVTAPCDSPLVPSDLVERLYKAMEKQEADISVAHDGERMQPVFALLRCALLESIMAFLDGGDRKIDRWYARHKTALADFSDRPETFLNVNTPDERTALEEKLRNDD